MKKPHGIMLCGALGEMYPSLIGRKIHPEFVEWMMGFPPEWTNPDCKHSATQLCQEWYCRSSSASDESKKEETNEPESL